MHKIGQSGGFLARILGLLLKTGVFLIGNVLKPLGFTAAAASATDAPIHKKMFGSGRSSDLPSRVTTLIISNEEMNDIMKIVKSLEESVCLIIQIYILLMITRRMIK